MSATPATVAGIGVALTMLTIPAVNLLAYRDQKTDKPADATIDDLLARPTGYVGRRRSGGSSEWQPAHTRRSRRAQHALADDGSGGWRVDLLLGETCEIDPDQIDRALTAGGRRG